MALFYRRYKLANLKTDILLASIIITERALVNMYNYVFVSCFALELPMFPKLPGVKLP
jgi:hypothetical protein